MVYDVRGRVGAARGPITRYLHTHGADGRAAAMSSESDRERKRRGHAGLAGGDASAREAICNAMIAFKVIDRKFWKTRANGRF